VTQPEIRKCSVIDRFRLIRFLSFFLPILKLQQLKGLLQDAGADLLIMGRSADGAILKMRMYKPGPGIPLHGYLNERRI
jgi:hypothetical protein